MKSLPLFAVLAATSATLASAGFAADGKSLGCTTTHRSLWIRELKPVDSGS